jgi:CRISPR-associated endonuclease/helicase Cas3
MLEKSVSAAPADLPQIRQPAPYQYVLRSSDLCDLFDTTPDLAGNHIDVSRFVRSGEETNVYVAWRKWDGEEPSRSHLSDRELCPAPRSEELTALLKKHGAWAWDFAKGKWERFTDSRRLYPGIRILLRSAAGGYTKARGWSPHLASPVQGIESTTEEEEDSSGRDNRSFGVLQTLEEHTNDVIDEMQALLKSLSAEVNERREELTLAARYHDWGKAHPVFQQTLQNSDTPSEPLLAKQRHGFGRRRHRLPWFRHELASALAMLQDDANDLAVYIVAAHHGKVRLNIRSMPGEKPPEPGTAIARGIANGDPLPEAHLGADVRKPAIVLSLDPAKMGVAKNGNRAWSDRVLDLLTSYGPFRLAYLEMLLRVADERASENAEKHKGAK